MSRYKSLYDLEIIFADGQVTEAEHLSIHKSFVEDPFQFTLYGVTVDQVDAKILLNFILGLLDDKVAGLVGPRSEYPLSNLALNILPRLFSILRQKFCPFSAHFKRIRRWDTLLYDVALNSMFHNNSRATWRRLFTELVIHDLDTVPNFDGSNGTVVKIHAAIQDVVQSVGSGELQLIEDSMQNFSSLSNWVSPANVTIPVLNGWSLLHLAASTAMPAQIYIYLVDTVGCDALRQDRYGRTALHVAAASLNFHALKVLTAKCPTSVRTVDFNDHSPLHVLLQSVSMRQSRKWIDSHHLQEAIAVLTPSSNPGAIWESCPTNVVQVATVDAGNGVRCITTDEAAAKENNFYRAIVHTDDHIAEEVVRIARRVPVAHWDLASIREALYKCAARPWERRTTVELLFREVLTKLVEAQRVDEAALVGIVDSCICAAVLGLKNAKRDRKVLKYLLERYVALVGTSVNTNETETSPSLHGDQEAAFVYLAALCGDADLLSFVLGALPRPLVRALVYPAAAQYNPEKGENSDNSMKDGYSDELQTRLRRFCNTLEPSAVQQVFQSTFSPLSLMCALNRADIAHVLMRSCFEVSAHQDSPAGKAAAQRAELDHFYPLYWAVKCGASECVRLIQNTLLKESLVKVYFQFAGPENRSLFQEVLLAIGRELPPPSTPYCPTIRPSSNVGSTKGYAECLQLVLDCLPADATKTTSLVVDAGLLDLPVIPDPSHRAVKLLQLRKEQIEAALRDIHAQSCSFGGKMGSFEGIWDAPYSKLQSDWTERRSRTQSVVTELSSKFVQTNLKLMCKKFTPDKKWIKLAYCVHRLFRALQPSPADGRSARDVLRGASPVPEVEDAPSVIDLAVWKGFLSLINRASKTADTIKDFITTLVGALRSIFTPHALLSSSAYVTADEMETHFDSLAVECAALEKIWNDNQIMVMTRAKSQSPLPYGGDGSNGDSTAPPHYQINDFKPDQRDVATYAALQGWLVAMLRDVRARADFKRLALSLAANDARLVAGETVLIHFHRQQLLSELKRTEALLVFAKTEHIQMSPISYILHCASTAHSTHRDAFASLQDNLSHGGLSAPVKVKRRRREADKVLHVKMTDKLLCVLVEFHARLGGRVESLLRDVLPLCARGLWRSAQLIVEVVAEKGHSFDLSHYNAMQRLVVSNDQKCSPDTIFREAFAASAGSLDLAVDVPATGSVTLLNPLHLAVKASQEVFIQKFLRAFPDFPVDFTTVLRFGAELKSCDIARILFAHCSGLQSQSQVQNVQQDVWSGVVRAESIRTSSEVLRAQFVALTKVASDAAEKLAVGGRDAQIMLYPPFTLVQARGGAHGEAPQSDSLVKLMNGDTVTWGEFTSNPRLLAMATPAPQRAGGLFNTGHNLLHEAALLSTPDLAYCLLRNGSEWRNRICQADKNGCTPLFNALQSGHYQLVDEMLASFEDDTSMHKNLILSELASKHSLPLQRSSAGVRESIMKNAAQGQQELESQFYIPRLRKTSSERIGKLTPFYGLRDYDVKNPVDVLARCLHGIDALWKKIVTTDVNTILHVFQYPGCAQLDSVVRARQVIALLGIPLSQLAIPSADAVRKQHAASHKVKEFTDLNPQKLKSLVTWPTAVQFRGIVCGWYRQRTAASPSQLDDTHFLFRNVDVSICDMGQCGTDVGKFLRRNSAYQRACDRVRVGGVESHARAQVNGALSEQLRMEFRFDHSSASRENMLRSGNLSALDSAQTSNTKVNGLLQSMQVDAATCSSVLSLSYLVLDFARALSVARQLVSITSLPAPRFGQAVAHPLDLLHTQIALARSRADQFRSILGLDVLGEVATLGEGINARIRVCAALKPTDLSGFFRISSRTSAKFAKLREFLVDGLTCILLDQDHLQLGEFVCRQALRADNPTTPVGGSTEAETVPRVSSKFAKIVDSELGFELVLRALQSLRVLDLISPKGSRMLNFARKNASQIVELLRAGSNELELCAGEIESQGKADSSTTPADNPQILREVSAYSAKRDQARVVQETAALQELALQRGYSVAKVLFDLIAAAVHFPREGVLYGEDVHQHVVNAQKKNPLIAICLQARLSQQRESSSFRSLVVVKASASAEFECCRKLLSLGGSPTRCDPIGRSPVALAALNGRAYLLGVLLENSVQDELRASSGYAHLLWHTVLAAGHGGGPGNIDGSLSQFSCIELLLQHDFPAETPDGCEYSTLELAVLMQCDASLLMKLCEARRSVCSGSSLQRTVQLLLLRGPKCPVDVVEILLKRFDKRALHRLLYAQFSVSEVLSGGGFAQQVVETHSAHVSTMFEADMSGTVKNVWKAMHIALHSLCTVRHRLPKHVESTVDMDLRTGIDRVHARANGDTASFEVPKSCGFFDLVFSARNEALTTLIIAQNLETFFVTGAEGVEVYFLPSHSDEEDTVEGFSLSAVVSSACVHNASGALVALGSMYEAWSSVHASSLDLEESGETWSPTKRRPGPAWSELLNRSVSCPELSGRAMTPLEAAVECNSAACIASLLAVDGVFVASAVFVSAIRGGRTDQHTALLLLQHLAPDKEHTEMVRIEFEDLDAFLSCTSHSDMCGDPSVVGETVLHLCSRRGYAPLVKHLLLLGADPLLPDEHGCTALDNAVAAGHKDVTRLMYPHCPDRVHKAVALLVFATRKLLLRRHRAHRK